MILNSFLGSEKQAQLALLGAKLPVTFCASKARSQKNSRVSILSGGFETRFLSDFRKDSTRHSNPFFAILKGTFKDQ